jgi:HEPN domain-containing protein
MQSERNPRYKDWLNQAKEDLKWGYDSAKTGHFGGACFLSQQCAEKALKALAFFRGFSDVRSHSIKKISESLGINGEIHKASLKLDQYYISTRYPDSVPEGHPAEFFDDEMAASALQLAEMIIQRVEDEIGAGENEQ